MKVVLYDDLSNPELKEKWDELLSFNSYKNIYLTYEWAYAWWKVFGDRYKLMIITVQENEMWYALAPFMIQKLSPVLPNSAQNLLFIGTGLSDYHDILLKQGFEKTAIESILKYLINVYKNWGIIRLRHFPENSKTPLMVINTVKNGIDQTKIDLVFKETVKCPYLPLNSNWELYYKNVSRNLRSDVARKLNKIKKKFKVEFEKIEPEHESDYRDYIDAFIKLNLKRWKQKNERNLFAFENPDHQKFYNEVTKEFAPKKSVLFYVLKLDSEIVAYIYCFKYNNVIYHWNTAFDPDYFRFSVGKILHRLAIEDAFRSGYSEFNFMRGDEDYKLKWTHKTRVNSEVILLNSKNLFSKYFGFYYVSLKPYLENKGFVNKGFQVKNFISNRFRVI